MTFDEWLPPGGWGCASSDEIARMAWDAALKVAREECVEICDRIASESEPDDFALDAINSVIESIRAP